MPIRTFAVSALLCAFYISISAQWDIVHTLPGGSATAIDAYGNSTVVVASNVLNEFQVLLSTDAGLTWQKFLLPAGTSSSSAFDISITDTKHIWAAMGDGRIIATSDGGTNWKVQFNDNLTTKFLNYIKMFDANNGIAMGDPADNGASVFLKTTDGGNNWNRIGNTPNGSSGDIWRRLDFTNNDCGFFYNSGGEQNIYATRDGGLNWTSLGRPLAIDVIKFYNDKIGVIYGDLKSVGKVSSVTMDGGLTWKHTNITEQGWGNDIEFLPGNPAYVWMTNGSNLYYSNDTAKTWNKTMSGFPRTLRDIVFTDQNNGWILGDYDLLYHTTNNGGVLVDIDNPEASIPQDYSLSQNYPNPFNPTTKIKYSVPDIKYPDVETAYMAFQRVTLTVYDVLGREVAVLVDGEKSPGNYVINFNASKLSSGIYFYTMRAGNFFQSRKMVLIK